MQRYLCAPEHPAYLILILLIYLINIYMNKLNHSFEEDIPSTKIILPCEKKREIKKQQWFLKGPVPYPWLVKASQLPGKALHVGIVIHFLHGVTKSEEITLKNSILREFGVARHSGYRALKVLENAGLISVSRKLGRNPVVTVLKG